MEIPPSQTQIFPVRECQIFWIKHTETLLKEGDNMLERLKLSPEAAPMAVRNSINLYLSILTKGQRKILF